MKFWITLFISIVLGTDGYAQFYDKKQVLAELKQYNKSPETYFNMKQEQIRQLEELQEQLRKSKEKVSDLMTELSEKNKVIEDLKLENARLKTELEIAKNKSSQSNGSDYVSFGGNRSTSGAATIGTPNVNSPYRVQIGRFAQYSMNQYLTTPKQIVYSNDGLGNVYEIAGFQDPHSAFELSQELRRLGIKGAFVTKYEQNQRVNNYNYLLENPNANVRIGDKNQKTPNRFNAQMQAANTPVLRSSPNMPIPPSGSSPYSSYYAPSGSSNFTPVIRKASGNMKIIDDNEPENDIMNTPYNSSPSFNSTPTAINYNNSNFNTSPSTPTNSSGEIDFSTASRRSTTNSPSQISPPANNPTPSYSSPATPSPSSKPRTSGNLYIE